MADIFTKAIKENFWQAEKGRDLGKSASFVRISKLFKEILLVPTS